MAARKVNRRGFLKAAGAAGLGAMAARTFGDDACEPNEVKKCSDPNTKAKEEQCALQQVPKRQLGKTGHGRQDRWGKV